MIKPNWDIFKAKFSENPEDNFEWFSYLLFCKEFNKPYGIFRYKNQSGIETNPIEVKEQVIGWQAKFYNGTLSGHKSDLLGTLEKSKRDYPSITKIILYTNSEWGQGQGSNDTKPKKEVEEKAIELGIGIEWRTASYFESEFVAIDNKIISSYFFSESPLIDLSPKKGWYPYENWANPSSNTKEEYIVSDETVLINSHNERKSIVDGINELRIELLKEKSAIRLVGLSGVGKTRFVQAIFDERIGENTPESSLVCYTDMSRNPDPSPLVMVEQLVEINERIVLVVDNCPPELHRELVKTVGNDQSRISLLTVEYDVREDLPDETDVYKLEPNGLEVIEKIILNRFDHINQINARSIAEFSGGNARIAIALAGTLAKSDTLTGLKDEELFQRLFQQRNGSNENLIQSAEVLSLVYSFNGKTTDDSSELAFLAEIIGKSALELYRDVEELKRRDLIQTRGDWRAVLPHAIANRLAKKALESMPPNYITNRFLGSNSDRLIKSFAHRLAFLHDSETAISIAEQWLAEDGWLGESECNFNELCMDAFKNIASVSPNKALECMERASKDNRKNFLDPNENSKSMDFVTLLRHLAYDIKYFDRAVSIICQFVVFEKNVGKQNTIEEVLKSLFWLTLSGTNTLAEQRITIVSELLESENEIEQKIGVSLLKASLKTGHFTSHGSFDFGARSRGLGWRPTTNSDVSNWYQLYIILSSEIILSNHPLSKEVRKLMADNFRGLWRNSFCFSVLIKEAKRLHDNEPWIEGWIAVKEAISFDEKIYASDIKVKINDLEEYLRPSDLYENAKIFIISGSHRSYDYRIAETQEDRKKREEVFNQKCVDIGAELGKSKGILFSLLEGLVCSDNYMLHLLIKGIASGYKDNKELWSLHYDKYKVLEKSKRQINCTKALLSYFASNDLDYFSELMDSLIDDDVFGEYFPWLQTLCVDNNTVKRLHKSLEVGLAPMWQYKNFSYGRNHENISDDDLAGLIEHLITYTEGINTSVEILSMRFHGKTQEKHSSILIETAYKLLALNNYQEDDNSGSEDHNLETILITCIYNLEDDIYAVPICKALSKGLETSRIANYHTFVQQLSKTYSNVFLEILFDDEFILNFQAWRFNFFYDFEENSSIVDDISMDSLMKWCDEKPEIRYPFVASIVYPLIQKNDELVVKPIIYALIDKTSVLDELLEGLSDSIEPQAWSGSRADVIENRLGLFAQLQSHENEIVTEWANKEYKKYLEIIKDIRTYEQKNNESRYERYE